MDKSEDDQVAPRVARMKETCIHLKEIGAKLEQYHKQDLMFRQKVKEQQDSITQLREDNERLRLERYAAQEEAQTLQEESRQLQVRIRSLSDEIAGVRSDVISQTYQMKNDSRQAQEDSELRVGQLKAELDKAQKHSEALASRFEEEVSILRKDAENKIRQMEEACREQIAARVAHERTDSATSVSLQSPSTSNQRSLKHQLRKVTDQARVDHAGWSTLVRTCTDLETKVRQEREAIDKVIERHRKDYGPYESLPLCKSCPKWRAQFAVVSSEWKAFLPEIAEIDRSLFDKVTQLSGTRLTSVLSTLRRLVEEGTYVMDSYLQHLRDCLHHLQDTRCRAFYVLVKRRGGIMSLARPRRPQTGHLTPDILFDSIGKTISIIKESQSSLKPESTMRPYVFDVVLDPFDSNDVLWTDHIQPLIENAFGGMDVTLLAYGQTGSGKTYTMCEKANSMVAKTIERIFERMGHSELNSPRTTLVKPPVEGLLQPETNGSESGKETGGQSIHIDISVFEIYRNKAFTLVGERARVDFRREKNQDGLDQYKPYYYDRKSDQVSAVVVEKREDCMKVFEDAMKRRSRRDMTAHGTDLNSKSSRSHLVCTLHLELINRDNCKKISNIQLVDLAGCEEIVTTVADPSLGKAKEEAREEGRAILASLSSLCDLLKSLRAGKSIEKGTWTSSILNTALHLGMSQPSPLIAFVACMRSEVPLGDPKAPDAAKQRRRKKFVDDVRSTCMVGSSLIVPEGSTRMQSRASSALGRRP